ncbi:uncharacterized protein CG7065 isoform X3 [Dendroctonus ponderosae]|uniref:uncharacterized protein CG7065 isoform X3 n=1 Tax=Dendroctonus ponderosae TaxID=77166 RepID=UPI0020361DCF|nr:uncharacterized protein CG7065 isoform X3 [Dendroctonus ponderosae]
MEPAAPGTEDEVVNFKSLNKKETENDRLLKIKAVLKNGQLDNVFELTYVNGGEHWFCRICECPIMGRVYQHELGRRHSINMTAALNRPGNRDFKEVIPMESEETPQLELAVGEPLPPGFEGEVTRKAQIQDRLDGFKVGPLVALEYLIEMSDYDISKEPSYLCILCDKKGDPRTVLTHLASYNHISQYLQKHFPSCYRSLAPYMTKQYKRNWQIVLQKIAEAIEKTFGRLKPFCIDQDKFKNERMFYLSKISKGPHFYEQPGKTFVELVVHEHLTKTFEEEARAVKANATSFGEKTFTEPVKQTIKRSPSPPVVANPVKKMRTPLVQSKKPTGVSRRRSLSSVSSISSDEDKTKANVKHLARNRSPPRDTKRSFDSRIKERSFRRRSPSPRRRSSSPRRRSASRRVSLSPRHKRADDDERRKNREKEKLQKVEEFHKLSKAIENDISKTLKQHEKNPEKHPKYNDEWKLFWNKRYKELQAEGKDASKYDFKPEWIVFWGKRMKELSNEELKRRKDGLRKRLGLPEEVQPISFRIGAATVVSKGSSLKETRAPNAPMTALPDIDPDVIVLDDIKDSPKKSNKDRSHSPWESDSSVSRAPSPKGRRLSRSPADRRRRSMRSRSNDRRSMEKRRSSERSRRSPGRTKRTFDRRSPERNKRSDRRSPDRGRRSTERRSSDKNRRSLDRRSRDRRSRSRDSYKAPKSFVRDRDLDKHLTEISRERATRESSFERDMRAKERIRTVAELPWEREKMMYATPRMPMDEFYSSSMMRDSRSATFMLADADNEPDDGEQVNIVSVLRLLTALEERLGALGPKIIDLLAQALALEKKEANSSETLLDNEINCVMFETVKEKLKGQLLAGLVDPVQERAFKKAIRKTANLIHLGSQRKKTQAAPVPGAVAVPGVGSVDKAAIAKQLANALIAQGKTDVTQAELEQLINAVVGMAEASKASNKPITAANFLSQLAGSSSESKSEKINRPTSDAKSKNYDPFSLDGLTEPLSPSTPEKSTTSTMENLSDSDLQTLLQNFKDLSTEEQMNLINYLKKLELNEPERVERLRKFVTLADKSSNPSEVVDLDTEPSPKRKSSPFCNRMGDINTNVKAKNDDKSINIHLDSEDEDYSYEDVVKAASKNIKQKEMEDNRKIVEDSIVFSSAQKESNLADAKALISNLMSTLSGVTAAGNMLGMSSGNNTASAKSTTISTSSAEFSKTLSSINMDSLANIVSNVQRATQDRNRTTFSVEKDGNSSGQDRNRFNRPGYNYLPPNNMPINRPSSQMNDVQSLGFDLSRSLQAPGTGVPARLPGVRPMNTFGPGSAPVGSPSAMHMNMRPRGGPGFAQFQRGPPPNQFGNTNYMNQQRPRQPFNSNFNSQRPGAPRGSNFNNW